MSLTYPSGEVVKTGDRIRYAGETGQVKFVADADDSATAWYVEQYGGGCMIVTEKYGRIFLDSTADEEDPEFISSGG